MSAGTDRSIVSRHAARLRPHYPPLPGHTLFTLAVSTHEPTPAAESEGGGSSRSGMVRVRVRVRRSRRGRRRLVLLGVLLVVVLAGVALALLARPLLSAKHEAEAAQTDLTAAKDALADKHIGQARGYVKQARAHVDRAQDAAGGLGGDIWS
jgi:hypothetical protein